MKYTSVEIEGLYNELRRQCVPEPYKIRVLSQASFTQDALMFCKEKKIRIEYISEAPKDALYMSEAK